jgi:transposase-like protein
VPHRHDVPTESDAELAARVTVEIRLRAVAAVRDGAAVVDVAEQFGVTRQTVTAWRRRCEVNGLEGLRDRSRRPHSSPHRISAEMEALICELRREHRRWGARRIAFELRRLGQQDPPSRSTRPAPTNGSHLPTTKRQRCPQTTHVTPAVNEGSRGDEAATGSAGAGPPR